MWLETKSIASSAQPEKKSLLGHKFCFGHIWQPGPSCPCPVAAQHEKLEENTEKQEAEATLKNQRQLGVEKSSWIWTQEPTAIEGTGKNSWNKTKQEGSQARAENWATAEAALDIPGPPCQLHWPPLRTVLTFSKIAPFLWSLSRVTR